MPTMAEAGPGPNQESTNEYSAPAKMAGTHVPEPLPAASKMHLNRKLESDVEVKTRTLAL